MDVVTSRSSVLGHYQSNVSED